MDEAMPALDDNGLAVQLGRLHLPNPVLVASGTFGYGREMAPFLDLSRLGGILPKSVTRQPRRGNVPWRTVETAAGLLNAIGLDNDGVDQPSSSSICHSCEPCQPPSLSAWLERPPKILSPWHASWRMRGEPQPLN